MFHGHRHTLILVAMCYRHAYCDGRPRKERCCVFIPRTYTAHLKHSVVLWLWKTYTRHITQRLWVSWRRLSRRLQKTSGTKPGHRPDWLHYVSFCHLARGRMAHRSRRHACLSQSASQHNAYDVEWIPGVVTIVDRG